MIAMLLLAAVQAAPNQLPKLLNPYETISNRDYPVISLRRNEFGIVSLVIRVSAAGTVTGCGVTETTGHRNLDALGCRLIRKRARFAPATDAAGNAIAADLRIGLSWGVDKYQPRLAVELPLTAPRLPANYKMPAKAQLVFDASGHVTDCNITETSGSATIDRSVCAYAARQVVIPAPKSPSGAVPAVAVRYVTVPLSVAPGG